MSCHNKQLHSLSFHPVGESSENKKLEKSLLFNIIDTMKIKNKKEASMNNFIVTQAPSGVKKNLPKVEIKESKRSLTSHSGIYLVDQFTQALNVREEIDRNVKVKERKSGYNVSQAILSLAYSMIAGGDCIDDVDWIRNDNTLLTLIGEKSTPHSTTMGDFLRRFNLGHIKQLEKSIKNLVAKVYQNEIEETATLDMDSSIFKVESKKEGADLAYNGEFGYHPLVCFIAENGDWLHLRMRRGSAYTSKGSVSFLVECLGKLPSTMWIRLRADSGFYDKKFVEKCESKRVSFTITAEQTSRLLKEVQKLPDNKWEKCKEGWEVAEFKYCPTGWSKEERYIVKREEIKEGEQMSLLNGKYKYTVFVTNFRLGSAYLLMKFHLKRGNMENYIREAKIGFNLERLPTGQFHANWVYMLIGMLAYNLISWMKRLVFPKEYKDSFIKRLRFRFIQIGGILVCTGRRFILYLQRGYLHLNAFIRSYERIQELGFV